MAALAALVTAVLLPGFAPFAAGPNGGSVLAGTFPGGERPGYVYLPPQYDQAKAYPVIYLLHGMPGSPSEYMYALQLATFADTQIASGRLEPFIAVVPAAGADHTYNGEWAGPWERELVNQIVPFVDAHLATMPSPSGRVIAGLSAGGFGAVYIGIRHPGVFGAIESWSGYFGPLRDGPFKNATRAQLSANDPRNIVPAEAKRLAGTRFFLSTGPAHSHWFTPQNTFDFAHELRALGLHVKTDWFPFRKGEWRKQFDAGLVWAFRRSGR